MKYKIHAVAALFPLMAKGSRPYNDLQEHIRLFGQLEAIVVDGDTLLDGRNRLGICEENGIAPKVVEWSTLGIKNPQHEWIFGKNFARRNLTEDERAAIFVEYNKWDVANEARQKKTASQFKAGNAGGPGGDRKSEKAKSTVNPNSGSPLKRDLKAAKANSTAGKVAAGAGVSRYKAEKIVALSKKADSGDAEAKTDFEAVKRGLKTIREVTQKAKPAKAAPNLETRLTRAWEQFWKHFSADEKPEVIKWINEQL